MIKQPPANRWLDIEEVRVVADLRIMHSKVDELHHVVSNLKIRHDESSIRTYADDELLLEDIRKVDEIYLWFISLKEETKKPAPQPIKR